MPTDKKTLARALIGTRTAPPGLGHLKDRAAEAWAYHRLLPYPWFHFKDWKVEDRGPFPRCLPIAKSITQRGARFLFGKPLQLMCAGNAAWETFLRDAWTSNALGARLVPLAVKGALESGIVLKFAYDETDADKPLSVQSLSIVDQVRLYYDPHDRDDVLMARVQYPYFDPAENKTFWYREEWTAEEEVHYKPLADAGAASRFDPDTSDAWEEDSRAANPFGLIPLLYIKNLETDDVFGALDLQDVYRVLDNLNLTFHLMNRSNQFDSELNPIFIDADLDEQDIDKPLQPAQPVDLQSKEGQHQAKVVFPSGANSLRPAMMDYAKEIKQQIMAAAGSVEVDIADVSHMGNMTRAVLTQTYLPLLEITEEKRKSWGEQGLAAFFALVAKGITNAGAQLGIDPATPATYAVTIQWPEYFELSEDEKAARTGRIQEQELAGYVTHDRAIEEIAPMEGRTDVEALKDELKKEAVQKAKEAAATLTATDPNAAPGAADPSLQNTENEIKGLNRLGGDTGK